MNKYQYWIIDCIYNTARSYLLRGNRYIECYISKSASASCRYSRDVLLTRFKLGERVILDDVFSGPDMDICYTYYFNLYIDHMSLIGRTDAIEEMERELYKRKERTIL